MDGAPTIRHGRWAIQVSLDSWEFDGNDFPKSVDTGSLVVASEELQNTPRKNIHFSRVAQSLNTMPLALHSRSIGIKGINKYPCIPKRNDKTQVLSF